MKKGEKSKIWQDSKRKYNIGNSSTYLLYVSGQNQKY